MANFTVMRPDEFQRSPFYQIGKKWMLITAEDKTGVNAMTASWGGLGVMWGKNVAFIAVRPQRFTKNVIDNSDSFSLCFFPEDYRETLSYMGTVSGREEDKVKKSGLTICHEGKTPYFQEARTVLLCKKLYAQQLEPGCFLVPGLKEQWYEEEDYHTMYIAEIVKILGEDK